MYKTICNFIVLTSFLCFSCSSGLGQKVARIDHQDMVKNVVGKKVQLVDVRTSQEYGEGHIEGAININVMENTLFKEQINSLSKEEPVYLYCKSGVRSKRAAEILEKEGFQKIFDYSGGYDDWKKSLE